MSKAGLSLLLLALAFAPAVAEERPILVELFTSEGCSSCPPADALLAELAARPDVLTLSFHVDYWDRLGWKDPFSSPAATRRQQHYADLLRLDTVYTPQIVVDGKWQAVGSSRAEVESIVVSALRQREEVPLVLAIHNGRAQITLRSGGDPQSNTVELIGFDRRHITPVAHGENAGRTLTHVDVVRSIEDVAAFDGRMNVIEVPLPLQCDRIAAIVQAPDGRILALAVGDADAQ